MSKDIQRRSYRALRAGPSSIDESTRSVEAVIATENPVTVRDSLGWDLIDEVLLMSGLTSVPDYVPLLDSHNRGSCASVLGSTRDIKVMGSELIARNYFAADPESVAAFNKVRDGHIKDNSVGYSVSSYQDLKPGEERMIGNQSFKAGERTLRIVTSWTLKENSVTPIGADPMAKMRSRSRRVEDMSERQFLGLFGIEDRSTPHRHDSDEAERRELARLFGIEEEADPSHAQRFQRSIGDPSDEDFIRSLMGGA